MVAPGDEFSVSRRGFNNSTGPGPIRVSAQLGPGAGAGQGTGERRSQIAEKREGVQSRHQGATPWLGARAHIQRAPRSVRARMKRAAERGSPAIAYRTSDARPRRQRDLQRALRTDATCLERRTGEASISTLPRVWGQGLTAYLENYEYSCTEQLVSKGMSLLILTSRPEFGTIRNNETQPLEGAFSMLRSRANETGGFGLWSSSPITAEFPTVYAAHFLVEARDRGQRIPAEVHVGQKCSPIRATRRPLLPREAARVCRV